MLVLPVMFLSLYRELPSLLCSRIEASQMPRLPQEMVGQLGGKLVACLESDEGHDGVVFMFLPKILSIVSGMDTVCVGMCWLKFLLMPSDGICFPGALLKTQLVANLCEARWPSSLVCNLVTNFRDVLMTEGELATVTNKFLEYEPNFVLLISSIINSVEIEELPPIIYQLLLFSVKVTKGCFHFSYPQGHQDKILKGIVDHFNKLDRQASTNPDSAQVQRLRVIQGTIILHIDLAIKRDQVSAKHFPWA